MITEPVKRRRGRPPKLRPPPPTIETIQALDQAKAAVGERDERIVELAAAIDILARIVGDLHKRFGPLGNPETPAALLSIFAILAQARKDIPYNGT